MKMAKVAALTVMMISVTSCGHMGFMGGKKDCKAKSCKMKKADCKDKKQCDRKDGKKACCKKKK